jgi:methionyl-tRNA synthetase
VGDSGARGPESDRVRLVRRLVGVSEWGGVSLCRHDGVAPRCAGRRQGHRSVRLELLRGASLILMRGSFHAIYLPAILHAMNLAMPRTLLAHAHWTAGQKKMSKSLGNVADPMAAMDDFGVDAVRFYLARVGGRFRDDVGESPWAELCRCGGKLMSFVDWSEEQLRKHADEIRNSLGNYFLRITSNTIKSRAAKVMGASSDPLSLCDLISRQFPSLGLSRVSMNSLDLETCKLSTNEELLALLDDLGARVSRAMRNLEVADALHTIVLILRHVSCFLTLICRRHSATIQQANALLTTLEPWSDVHPPDVALSCYITALETVRITGILLQPFIPHTSERLLDGLGVSADERSVEYARVGKGDVGGGLVMAVRGVKLFEKPTKKGSSES